MNKSINFIHKMVQPLERALLKAVLFDFDGTLTDFLAADIQALESLHQAAQISLPLEQFVEISVEEIMAFHTRVEQGLESPLEMHLQRLERTFRRIGRAWNPEYLKLYQTRLIEKCVPLEGAAALLSTLRPHYKLGLLTNAYDALEQRSRIKASGLEHFFEAIVVSGELGIYKPDPGIFLHLLGQLEVQPCEAVYVGDSPRHDVEGAIAAGMQAILIREGEAHPRASLTVPNLSALLESWQAG